MAEVKPHNPNDPEFREFVRRCELQDQADARRDVAQELHELRFGVTPIRSHRLAPAGRPAARWLDCIAGAGAMLRHAAACAWPFSR
jgi:hypothetical protein